MVRWPLAPLLVCALCLAVSEGGRVTAAGRGGADQPHVALAGELNISEFRLRGRNGPTDEFIEIYNASGGDHTVAAASGSGYGIAASDGVTRCLIPNGTVIPNAGHFLCVNSAGYSLGSYPAGSGTTATGDATYTLDIADNAGIALFNNNSGGVSYSMANRLDAVGSTLEGNALYKEGTGYPAISGVNLNYSFMRRAVNGCTGSASGNCPTTTLMQTTPPPYPGRFNTNDNSFDFIYVEPDQVDIGAGYRLGAPGPENLSSPMNALSFPNLTSTRFDTCLSEFTANNKIRDTTSDPANQSALGTLDIRRTWTNDTGAPITRLRFRVVEISTFPSITGVADLRARTSGSVVSSVSKLPCGSGTSAVIVNGTTLEEPPTQVNAGGYNSTLSVPTVTPAAPLAAGASLKVRMLLGVEQIGIARFCVVAETIPISASSPSCFIGSTETDPAPVLGDIDYDQKTDLSYASSTGAWLTLRSSDGFPTGVGSFTSGFQPVLGDFDGDGRLDGTIYRESTGDWILWPSSNNRLFGYGYSWGGVGWTAVPGDYDGDGSTDIAVYSAATGSWDILTSSSNFTVGKSINWGGPGYTAIGGLDFDGDHKADLTLYNERLGEWFVLKSGSNYTTTMTKFFGGSGYTLVPGDYDGDGRADVAVYGRATGLWSVLTSSSGWSSGFSQGWGGPGYVPVVGDFDGDGKDDLMVRRAATRQWLALESSTSFTTLLSVTTGAVSDEPLSTAVVPEGSREMHGGDFDGDFTSDLTVYNTTTGVWSRLFSHGGFTSARSTPWGGTGYTPAPGDYDGDGKADLAVYQQSTGQWSVLKSSSNFTTTYSFNCGGPGYIPVAADYDGDGRTDMVVYNTTTGTWFGLKSSSDFTTPLSVGWGGSGYTAAPGDFDGDGKADLALYQASTGNWVILTSSSNYSSSIVRNLGGVGYVPVQADYDGDGITDFAVYQPTTGFWTVLKSSTGNALGLGVSYGGAGFTPVAGDWDGDGRADIGVYDASGNWSILLSSSRYTTTLTKNWGGAGYAPVPAFP